MHVNTHTHTAEFCCLMLLEQNREGGLKVHFPRSLDGVDKLCDTLWTVHQ